MEDAHRFLHTTVYDSRDWHWQFIHICTQSHAHIQTADYIETYLNYDTNTTVFAESLATRWRHVATQRNVKCNRVCSRQLSLAYIIRQFLNRYLVLCFLQRTLWVFSIYYNYIQNYIAVVYVYMLSTTNTDN